MPTVLIVSPHFPPVDAVDMHRIRISLSYFSDFGWTPIVLTVDPKYVERLQEPLLIETVPSNILICRVKAFQVRLARKIGIGSIAFRSWPFLYAAGKKLIKKHHVDLVFFSTTMFPVMSMGRLWKKQFGVPFVLDMQDPWYSEYYDDKPKVDRPPKYLLAKYVNKYLESWTMRSVDGILSVSQAYHETLRKRYFWMDNVPCYTLPFGASSYDYEVGRRQEWCNPFFQTKDGLINGVYVGALGKAMQKTCHAICIAFKKGMDNYPHLFNNVRLYFIGTSYVPSRYAEPTIQPIAEKFGLADYVHEFTDRVSYFQALSLLAQADFLIVPGSDDPQYTASKIYPYILARKPILAVFHESSSVVDVLEKTRAGEVVTFNSTMATEELASDLFERWLHLLRKIPCMPQTDWAAFQPYTAREMTKKQCDFFDNVLKKNGCNM